MTVDTSSADLESLQHFVFILWALAIAVYRQLCVKEQQDKSSVNGNELYSAWWLVGKIFVKRHRGTWTESSGDTSHHFNSSWLPPWDEGGCTQPGPFLLLTAPDLALVSLWLSSPVGSCNSVLPSVFPEAGGSSVLEPMGYITSAFQTAKGMGDVPHGIAYM